MGISSSSTRDVAVGSKRLRREPGVKVGAEASSLSLIPLLVDASAVAMKKL
jgi:hypothetical protein